MNMLLIPLEVIVDNQYNVPFWLMSVLMGIASTAIIWFARQNVLLSKEKETILKDSIKLIQEYDKDKLELILKETNDTKQMSLAILQDDNRHTLLMDAVLNTNKRAEELLTKISHLDLYLRDNNIKK